MNTPPQRISWLQGLARNWQMIMLSIISVAMGYVVWDRPIPPTWVYTPPTGSVGLIGLTRDGRVVAVDYPTDDVAQDRFRILDIKTGRVLSEFAIPFHESINFEGLKPRYRRGAISGDDQIAVIEAPGWSITLFVNLQTGELVHPPYLGASSVGEGSPDGRYVVLNVSDIDEHGNSTGSSERLFDLKTGQLGWTCEQDTQFSPDSQSFLCYERDDEQRRVTIRSVRDNSTILSDSVPSIPGGENAEFHSWSGTRLYVNYSFDVPGSPVPERRCWSYATTGTRLSDQKREPLIGGYLVNPRCLVDRPGSWYRFSGGGWEGLGRGCLGDAFGEDLGERLFCPLEGMGHFVPFLDERHQSFCQVGFVLEVGDAESFALEDAEPLLDLVHPRAMDWRMMEREPGVFGQPGLDLFALVHANVVEHDIDGGDR